MAIPLSGNVSLTQVRSDVGLSAAGSMSERAVQNHINRASGASMTQFRGACAGTQRAKNGTKGNIQKPYCNWEFYSNAYPNSYCNVNSSGTITTNCYCNPGGWSDAGVCFYLAGTATTNPYRLRGSASFTGGVAGTDAGACISQMSIIISTGGGWLEGYTEVVTNEQKGERGSFSQDSGDLYGNGTKHVLLCGYTIVYESHGQSNGYHNWDNAILRIAL